MPKRSDIKSILILGAGPIIIGQACEFDYSGAQACKALREEGYRVILVNSNPEEKNVQKLSYQVWRPYIILEDLGANSFLVQKYNDPNSSKKTFKGHKLYLFPPSPFTSERLDTLYELYMNYFYAPVPSPLK